MFGQGTQAPSIEVQSAFSMDNSFKKYFVRKTGEVGGELLKCY